ncbi:MPN domain-containing protein [Chloropicon roscoffensis]|uniref:MPN domain-containing protein n=1 Tax=Chloropicon roscoffensis TaxID=1461544 RepID=A0AAX4PEV3_9CHLO
MGRGNGVVAGESLPAMAPDETAIAVPCHLYPAQDVVQDRKQSLAEGASALHDSSANGKTGEAWTKAQVARADAVAVEAEAKAKLAVAKADAEARVAVAEALEAEAKAKVADAEARAADAEARVAEAQAATKVRMATAESIETDLKIVKLRKELEVLSGVQLDGGDKEQRSGTVHLEDLDFNEKKNSSPRSSRFREDDPPWLPAQKKQKKKIKPKAKTKARPRVPKRPERGLGCTKCRHSANGCSDCGYYEDEAMRAMQEEREDRQGFDCRAQSSQGRLTLQALMKEGLMEPGQGVLRVEYKGHVFLADLTPSGSISYEGELFESPSSWSTHVKRRVFPGLETDSGWESVFYVTEDGEKTKLKQLRKTHAHKMCGFGSFEKETATATKVKSELAARAPAAEQAECCPAHRHQAHADPLGGLTSPDLLSRGHDPSYHGVECVQPSPSNSKPA